MDMTKASIPTWEELEKILGKKLYSFNEMIEVLGLNMDTTTFNRLMKEKTAWLSKLCYEVGVEVKAKQHRGYSKVTYAIEGEELMDFLSKHKKVSEIAAIAGIDKGTIGRYIAAGKLNDIPSYPYCSFNLYNVQDVISRIKEIQNNNFKEVRTVRSNLTEVYDSCLPEEILNMIDKYIKHRLSKAPGITIGGFLVNKNGFVKENRAHFHRQTLKSIFFEIICSKEGIKYDKETKAALQNGHTDRFDDIELVYQTDFTLGEFDEECVTIIEEKYKGLTFQNYMIDVLRPFFFYYLMVKEKEMLKNKRKNNLSLEERYILSENFDILKLGILDIFNKIDRHEPEPDVKKKIFLSREQYSKLYAKVFNQQGISKAVALELAFRLGLRANEATLVAVEDFWIDENGYLLTDEKGFGWLYLPAVKCKGAKNGGAEDRGKPVPFETVKTINLYLKDLYSKSPFPLHKRDAGRTFTSRFGKKVYENGHGFLLRDYRFPYVFNKPISKTTISQFLKKIRGGCDFLDHDQRKYLSYHDGRHTLNEWIETSNVETNLRGFVDFVADFQMHHTGSRDVGKKRYRNKDIFDVYHKIIDASINFPLDLPSLRKWEIEHHYREVKDNEVVIDEKTTIKISTDHLLVPNSYEQKQQKTQSISAEEKTQLSARLKVIESELERTVQKPKEMKAIEWSSLRVKLVQERDNIERKLSS